MKKQTALLAGVCLVGILSFMLSIMIFVHSAPYVWAAEELTMEEKININVASREDLILLKRIGPSLADRIIAYREEHGPFTNPEDILNVKGLGPKFWEANRDRITIGEIKAKAD